MENEVWTDSARIPLVFMSQNCYPLQSLNLIWFWVYLRHILTGGASFSDCTASRNLPLRLTYFKPDKNPCGWSEEDTNISFHTLENIFPPCTCISLFLRSCAVSLLMWISQILIYERNLLLSSFSSPFKAKWPIWPALCREEMLWIDQEREVQGQTF